MEKWNDTARTHSDKNRCKRFDLWTTNRRRRRDCSDRHLTVSDARPSRPALCTHGLRPVMTHASASQPSRASASQSPSSLPTPLPRLPARDRHSASHPLQDRTSARWSRPQFQFRPLGIQTFAPVHSSSPWGLPLLKCKIWQRRIKNTVSKSFSKRTKNRATIHQAVYSQVQITGCPQSPTRLFNGWLNHRENFNGRLYNA